MPALAKYLDLDSHCPEDAVLFAAMCFTQQLLAMHPKPPTTMNNTHVYYGLDNKSITMDSNWRYNLETLVFDYLKADYDILHGVLQLKESLPLECSIYWVKGHQDDNIDWEELMVDAKPNCYMDCLCSHIYSR